MAKRSHIPLYRFGPYDTPEIPYGAPSGVTQGYILVDGKRYSLFIIKYQGFWCVVQREWVGPDEDDVTLMWQFPARSFARAAAFARALNRAPRLAYANINKV